jgi:hypothetical protein
VIRAAAVRAAAVAALVCGGLAGCVTPAPTTSDYAGKAVMTAEAATSAARTAVLATRTYTDGRLTGPYLEATVTSAEETLGSVSSTFSSIQPPATASADRLRAQLGDLLDEATSNATELRIASRRTDDAALTRAADGLATAADDLEDFAREHGP